MKITLEQAERMLLARARRSVSGPGSADDVAVGPEAPLSPPAQYGDSAVVCLCSRGAPEGMIDRAVDSIMAQTYPEVRLVLVSDGSDAAAEDMQGYGSDPRILVVNLPERRGQYLAYDAVAMAMPDTFFAVQDDDDVSKPTRIERLARALCEHQADYAIGTLEIHLDGQLSFSHHRIVRPSRPPINPISIPHIGSHVGMWLRLSLCALGGYTPRYTRGLDSLLLARAIHHIRAVGVSDCIYEYHRRPGSETMNEHTGIGTRGRAAFKRELFAMYGEWVAHDDLADAVEAVLATVPEDLMAEMRQASATIAGLAKEKWG